MNQPSWSMQLSANPVSTVPIRWATGVPKRVETSALQMSELDVVWQRLIRCCEYLRNSFHIKPLWFSTGHRPHRDLTLPEVRSSVWCSTLDTWFESASRSSHPFA